MKKKGWIIVIIVLLPSLIWILLDISTIQSKKLNYYGPKKISKNNQDTIFYSVDNIKFFNEKTEEVLLDTNIYNVFLTIFIRPEYVQEQFRISQFLTMTHYEPEKIKHIPIILVYPFQSKDSLFHIKDSLKIQFNNVHSMYLPDSTFNTVRLKFFLQKPYYVDYSFAVLLDKNRHIRGYYDWRYADEIKRTIKEFNHLLIKEGYKETLQKNKIEKK